MSSCCFYSGRIHQGRNEVEVFCKRDFMSPELSLPDVLQQHVTEILVEWPAVRQEASELEHVTDKSAEDRSR